MCGSISSPPPDCMESAADCETYKGEAEAAGIGGSIGGDYSPQNADVLDALELCGYTFATEDCSTVDPGPTCPQTSYCIYIVVTLPS